MKAENPHDLSPETLNHSPAKPAPRVLLFDIDGTLIRAARRPEYRGLMRGMLTEIFGTCGRISEVDFAGRTDLSIYREALECEGISMEVIRERLPLIEKQMVDILHSLAQTGTVFYLCKGVRELLNAIQREEAKFIPSLLTGNVESLAEAKLRHVDIWHYFKGRGAFGSDDENRDHLPAIAAERLREHSGIEMTPEQFIIIGDTPRDIACARHFGAKVVAVATGIHSVAQLSACEPDVVLEDLNDTEQVMDLFNGI